MLSWVYDEGMLVLEIVCGKASGRLCELVSAVCWTCIQWRTGGAMKSKHTKTPSHSSRPRLQGYMRKLFYMMDHDGTILSNFFTEAGLLDSLWQKIASKHLSLGVHLGHFDWTRKKRQTNWDGTSWNCLLESFTLLSCNLDFCLNSFSGRPLRQVEANRDTYMLQKYAKIMFCIVLLLTSRLLSPKGLYQTMGPDNKWQQDLPVYQQEHSALT